MLSWSLVMVKQKTWSSYISQVGLGVTTVLTMTTLINSVNAALPKISYMKSIDKKRFLAFLSDEEKNVAIASGASEEENK